MFIQLLFNGLVVGSSCVLLGIGLNLSYLGSGFFNISYGSVLVLAAYTFCTAHQEMQLGIVPSSLLAAVSAIAMAIAQERIVFEPLRRLSASSQILLLCSIALLIIVQNGISLIFGDQARNVQGPEVGEGLTFLPLRVMPLQIATMVTATTVAVFAWVFLKYAETGKQIRALASDSELSAVVGIHRARLRLLSGSLGAITATLSAVLATCENGAEPAMGFNAALLGVVTLVVGGVGSIGGAVLAGLFLGIVRQLAIGWFPGQWQDGIVFIILFLFVLIRPQGLLGSPARRKAT
ncbi:MAG TPA: branched-chain amino acid ABC transporter permease [Phycisphaerae bacterium]|nr:branched-chain amino acid ABC transporter permease [Phycisphaerae bacterium]